MAYSPITGTGNGTAPVVNLTWPFITPAHVKASVAGVAVAVTWTGASQITFDAPVANGAAWRVYRDTPINTPLVDYADPAVLSSADLDLADTQLRYHQEELSVEVDDGIVAAEAERTAAQAAATSASSSATAADASADAAAASAAAAAQAASIPNASVPAATRSALAGLATSFPAILHEAGREGVFVWDPANLASKVSADTAQGIYVAPASDTSGASGAWVRRFSGPVNPAWFGVSTANTGAQNDAAILSMFATLRARSTVNGVFYISVEPIQFPQGTFNFASTVELTDGIWIIEGVGQSDDAGTILKFPAGVGGIIIHRYNTVGVSGTRAGAKGSDRSIVRNLVVDGAYSGVEGEYHGIQLRARATIENVTVSDFQGDGVYIAATAGGAQEGNANGFRLENLRLIRNRDGVSIGDGGATADVNAGVLVNVDASANRRWGFADRSFLGNTHIGGHASANGATASGSPSAAVSYSGNRYSVVVGQEVGASTNAPSGTTADNTWWLYVMAGGVHPTFPAWVSGTTYRAGGSYLATNGNARNAFIGCYHESDQGVPQIASPSMAVGGTLADSVTGTGAALLVSASPAGALKTKRAFLGEGSNTNGTYRALLGDNDKTNDTLLAFYHSTYAPSYFRFKFLSNDLVLDYANSGVARPFYITGPTTTQQFGTGAAVTYAFAPVKLMIGDFGGTLANFRRIGMEAAVPAANAHAQGEIWFNRTPSPGSPIGWRATAAGTPGTWEEIRNALPTGQTIASAATVTPTFSNDYVTITAQAAGLTLANWTGTAIDFWGQVVRIKDNGTARAIAYGANYQAADGVTLPTTTVVGKTHVLAFIHDSVTGKHVCTSVLTY